MSHKKFGPDRFSRFDVYWIQTDRQTNRQAKFIYRLCIFFRIFKKGNHEKFISVYSFDCALCSVLEVVYNSTGVVGPWEQGIYNKNKYDRRI